MTRREFIGEAVASVGLAGCASMNWIEGSPSVSFGVVSDIHITTQESTEKFRRALRHFKSHGANAVLVAGDLSDWGLRSGLACVKEAWDAEMKGTGIVPLMITGNHDYDGWWYGDMTLHMHLSGYSEDEALSRLGMKECWEEMFGEPFAEIRVREVNGFKFVSSEWCGTGSCENGDRTAKWLEDHRAELSGSKPFFFFRHAPIPNTVSSSKVDTSDLLFKTLSTFPNCIAFNGHTHWTFNDERSIWQGGFTVMSVPSLEYTSVPGGYENGRDRRTSGTKLGMPCVATREYSREAQGYFIQVYAEEMRVERVDFEVGKVTVEPWIVPLRSEMRPYSFVEHANRVPVPQFATGAVAKMRFVNSDTRNGSWTVFVALEFPSAKASDGRAFDYVVRTVGEDGTRILEKRFISPTFDLPPSQEADSQSFLFNGFDLPEMGCFRFEVVARNCFGVESRPIYSNEMCPKPGRDKTKYRSWRG